jgi:hypothetical protein
LTEKAQIFGLHFSEEKNYALVLTKRGCATILTIFHWSPWMPVTPGLLNEVKTEFARNFRQFVPLMPTRNNSAMHAHCLCMVQHFIDEIQITDRQNVDKITDRQNVGKITDRPNVDTITKMSLGRYGMRLGHQLQLGQNFSCGLKNLFKKIPSVTVSRNF